MNKIRTLRIARSLALLSESETSLKQAYDELKAELLNKYRDSDNELKHLIIVDEHKPTMMYVNGYVKQVRRCVNKVMNKYKNLFECQVYPDGRSRRFTTILLRPCEIRKAKAKFENGTACFLDGPFKGREVNWSSRKKQDLEKLFEKHGDKTFYVQPDIWNSSFYGWNEDE